MPRSSKGARLYLKAERRNTRGDVTHAAVWEIRDGGYRESTGCAAADLAGAEAALERHLNRKHTAAAQSGKRDPAATPIADVLNLYAAEIAPQHARPREALQHIARLAAFFGDKTLADISGALCRAYVRKRGTEAGAGRDLSVLRAAINFHREEGYCDRIVSVAMPGKSRPRERWLTRSEAAALIWCAWRYREVQKGHATGRRSRQHVARFILVALYTGTRAGAVCGAAFEQIAGAGYIDLERGIFYRRPMGANETKKRRPPVPLPQRLLAHLRRWQRRGQRFCVEWNGRPVHDVDKAFRRTAAEAELVNVTPHTLRHTAATWLMQRGVDMAEAAGFLGMTTAQLEHTYGHHHPDHLTNARGAMDWRPGADAGKTEQRGIAPVSHLKARNRT
jgi:integrase